MDGLPEGSTSGPSARQLRTWSTTTGDTAAKSGKYPSFDTTSTTRSATAAAGASGSVPAPNRPRPESCNSRTGTTGAKPWIRSPLGLSNKVKIPSAA